ncbi:hypothetical protein [Nocardia sp. NPDC051570]|uniref:hypothetical protein n=1 Tax=Nocardia sp. NPDC051570 TaxID=3364324 RepID=UPI00378FAAD8
MSLRVKHLLVLVLLALFPMLASPSLASAGQQAVSVGWSQPAAEQPRVPEPPSACRGFVHFYAWSGQPVDNWQARVAGTDLDKLVNDDSGVAFIEVTDNNGRHDPIKIWWDNRGHPLNYLISMSGQNPSVYVSVLNHNESYVGCGETITVNHP